MLIDRDRHEHEVGWTDARIEILKSMWIEGRSASEIAVALGGGVSRSAVIGKVHRLKLPAHGPNPKKSTTPKAKAVTPEGKRGAAGKHSGTVDANRNARATNNAGLAFKINQARKDGLTGAEGTAAVLGRTKVEFDDPVEHGIDTSRLVSLMKLTEHTCKWPIGDPLKPGFGFCGAHVDAAPYCDHHRKRAFHHL